MRSVYTIATKGEKPKKAKRPLCGVGKPSNAMEEEIQQFVRGNKLSKCDYVFAP